METDQNGTPEKQSFYFGFKICALCLDLHEIPKRERRVCFIWPPHRGADNEILIPGKRQAFHKACLERLDDAESA